MFYYLVNHHSLYGLKTFLFFLLPGNFKTNLRVGEKGYINKEFSKKYKKSNFIPDNLYNSKSLKDALIDHFDFKLEHLLKWEDLNSMWFSLEARVPFLDYRLVERTLATSSDLIIKEGITKHILRAALKGYLPEKIRTRKDKIGFETPQKEWFKEPLWRSYILDLLNSKSFAERGIINQEEAIRTFNLHFSGKIDASNEIWKWMHLEMWFKEFID